jgi:hypothetical protein
MDETKYHEKKQVSPKEHPTGDIHSGKEKVKFECYGIEIIEKEVRRSGSVGRIYLPPDWQGKSVKIIRID